MRKRLFCVLVRLSDYSQTVGVSHLESCECCGVALSFQFSFICEACKADGLLLLLAGFQSTLLGDM